MWPVGLEARRTLRWFTLSLSLLKLGEGGSPFLTGGVLFFVFCLFVVLLDTVFHVIMHLVLHLVPNLLSFVSPSQKWIKNKKQMHCLAAAVQSVVAWDQMQRGLSTYKSIHK